jgi:uncharacterized protein YbbC (DUF1343 family)
MKLKRFLCTVLPLALLAAILVSMLACAPAKVARDSQTRDPFRPDHLWAYDGTIQPGAASIDEYLPLLQGKRVCLLSNQTGIMLKKGKELPVELLVSDGSDAMDKMPKNLYSHVLDTLLSLDVNIVCLMSPEHGFRGTADAGEHVSSGVDLSTGIPIRSLYGTKMTDKEMMEGFDVMLFDLQDVGVRFYTYYVTMIRMMGKCAKFNIPFIVLDRPNPIGFLTDGPMLDRKFKSGVGGLPIPVAHGMTMGELAYMANEKGWLNFPSKDTWEPDPGLKCDLTVIKCRNYRRNSHYRLPVKPSPNLPNMRSVYLYPSTCYFEGTRISLGRGTTVPFQIYGAPDMSTTSFQGRSPYGSDARIPAEYKFTPRSIAGAKNPPLLDKECTGVSLAEIPLNRINDGKVNLTYIIDAYIGCGSKGNEFFTRMFELETGQEYVRKTIIEKADNQGCNAGKLAKELQETWEKDIKAFKKERAPYLLYK